VRHQHSEDLTSTRARDTSARTLLSKRCERETGSSAYPAVDQLTATQRASPSDRSDPAASANPSSHASAALRESITAMDSAAASRHKRTCRQNRAADLPEVVHAPL